MSCDPDELMSKLEKSDAATIKTIVSNLPDPNAPVYFGETLLYLATSKGNLDLIRHLVGYVDLNAQGFSGSALHESIVNGHQDITSFLIENGADINQASIYLDQYGFSPLHTAILSSNEPATELLLKMNADVNARDSNMNTPLHIASQTGNYHAAALLLSHGASMAAINSNNETPFCVAIETGSLNILKLFLTNGIHKNDPQFLNNALVRAIDTKNASVVQFMIDNGADVNFVSPYQKFTPLHFAVNANEIKTIEILLQYSANVLARSESNSLPIFYAGHRKNSAMVDLLLDRHSEIDLEHGKELIYEAVMNDCPLVVEKILTHRIYNLNIDDLTASGVRLLDVTATGKLDILKLFLNNGIHKHDPLLLNNSLKRAIDSKNASVVQFMIDNGADVNFVSPYKKFTPLHFAIDADELKIIETLLRNSANVLSRSESDSLPIFYADHQKKSAMVDLLLDRHSEIDLEHGKELIYEAVMNDCPLVVEKLLTHRLYNLNVDELTASGVRLLDAAILNKKESSADVLLKCGANSELRSQGVTSIDLAIRCKNYYFFYSWLKYGGNFYNYHANQSLYLSRLEKIIEMNDSHEDGAYVMEWELRDHLILMKSAGYFTHSRYDELTDGYGTREKASIEWDCEQELERAKRTFVGGVSCWDLLTMEDRRLMTWSRKPEVKTIMEEGKFEIPFHYCDRWLMSCYRRGVRRPGLVNKFGECFGEIFSDLGFDEVEKVLIYLTNDDIGNLISVCEGQ
ncbi:putative ankyrin repeat protein RF_0381 [Microplitis mediator]|uniref:putative ankyrin repeat protein RF_0381 n=1 Tax=Microplitis mediator TaxID=375433 RepID=UPI0025569CC7|nr:putative ankyrin repeat protein RF_0381 [Microplitis mediator]